MISFNFSFQQLTLVLCPYKYLAYKSVLKACVSCNAFIGFNKYSIIKLWLNKLNSSAFFRNVLKILVCELMVNFILLWTSSLWNIKESILKLPHFTIGTHHPPICILWFAPRDFIATITQHWQIILVQNMSKSYWLMDSMPDPPLSKD